MGDFQNEVEEQIVGFGRSLVQRIRVHYEAVSIQLLVFLGESCAHIDNKVGYIMRIITRNKRDHPFPEHIEG